MRRMILVLTVLAFAMPALGAVTITAVNEGIGITGDPNIGVVRIDYSSDANVSAFALEIELDEGATVNDVNDYFIGECNGTQKGFGIFLDQTNGIKINSQGGVVEYGSPVVDGSSPDGTGTGLGTSKVILEMGALYEEGNQPALSGTLCKIRYNSCNDCNLTVAVNATRGGVVLETAVAASVILPGALQLADTNGPDCQAAQCIVPDVVDTTQAAASAAIVAAGLVVGNVTSANSDTIIAGNVISQNPAATTAVDCGSAVDLVISLGPAECMTAGHMTPDYTAMGGNPLGAYSDYADWLAVEKPDCWCASGPANANPRQCWGDADKFAEGGSKSNYWVYSEDLNILLAAWGKAYSLLQGQTYNSLVTGLSTPLICADFDHFAEGGSKSMYRVYSYDLNIMLDSANWGVVNGPSATCP